MRTSTHWDRRKLRVLCVIVASLGLAAVLPAAASARAPKLTLHADDGLDWGFGQNAAENTPAPGDTIKTTLRVGNGGQGQRGYARRLISPKPFVGGQKSEVNFPIGSDDDDETRAVKLPFRFFFAGIPYKKVSVSTNGWIEFGGPALDYFDDIQLTDFRGEKAVMGRFFRGAMPYFADLDLTNGTPNGANFAVQPGTVTKAVSSNRIAFQWDAGYCCNALVPERTFEVVLFKNGRIRYDYPGMNDPGGPNLAFVGLSGGNGRGSLSVFKNKVTDVPGKSVLYTPRGGRAGKAPKGTLTATLPAGSNFAGGPSSNGCHVTKDPTVNHGGKAKCKTPALGNGDSAVRTVAWKVPDDPFDTGQTPNLAISATYRAGGEKAKDDDESAVSDQLQDTTINAVNTYDNPASPTVGDNLNFDVSATAGSGGLFAPIFKFHIPAGTRFQSTSIPGCNHPTGTGGVTITCHVPYSGDHLYAGDFTIRATTTGAKTTNFTASAANAPADSDPADSPFVGP
jgi:hypothetical protein